MGSNNTIGDNKTSHNDLRRLQKIIPTIVFIVFSALLSYGSEKIIPLTNLDTPSTIIMNNERIYIEDGPTIKLFSSTDYKYIKTIGREGQGPGEFQNFANPQILDEFVLVSSSNKISYFSLAGEFIEDKRHALFATLFRAIENKYVGYIWIFKEDYVAYILYDSDLKPIKELHRGKALIHPNRRRDFFEIHFYDTYKDKIVVAQREGFVIDIFDSNGNWLHSIKHKIKPVPFTNEDKKNAVKYWKDSGLEQWQIDRLLERTDFPDYYPTIQTCRLADGKIYVITYAKKDEEYECLIFDVNGKFIKEAYLPLKMLAPNHASPFTIHGEKLFQLNFNDDTENWDLHVEEIR